jgi:hypothetical protein
LYKHKSFRFYQHHEDLSKKVPNILVKFRIKASSSSAGICRITSPVCSFFTWITSLPLTVSWLKETDRLRKSIITWTCSIALLISSAEPTGCVSIFIGSCFGSDFSIGFVSNTFETVLAGGCDSGLGTAICWAFSEVDVIDSEAISVSPYLLVALVKLRLSGFLF